MNSSVVKIAVLEWICGGGLLTIPAEKIDDSLRVEGWQMLTTLVDGLASAGMHVVVPLDQTEATPHGLHSKAHIVDLSQTLSPTDRHRPLERQAVLSQWQSIAQHCDYAWIVAPEIDDVLGQAIEQLRASGVKLLNCDGDFLRQCNDKRQTAQRLIRAGIPHPPTRELATIDEDWIRAHSLGSETSARWVIKPSRGAGGWEQYWANTQQLLQIAQEHAARSVGLWATSADPSPLVQSWIAGRPASCSAIVNERGQRSWLPLVSQDFAVVSNDISTPMQWESVSSLATKLPHYIGCTFPCKELPREAPRELLEATLDSLGSGAFGCVGIDLIYDGQTQNWTVIEVNARCTSSIVGLAAACQGTLVFDVFSLLIDAQSSSPSKWKPIVHPFQFRLP